jgi:hypothetical protein
MAILRRAAVVAKAEASRRAAGTPKDIILLLTDRFSSRQTLPSPRA